MTGRKIAKPDSLIQLSSTMVSPVLSLSSLSARVVVAQDLDTRQLPLHLHREMEQYRRIEGIFTLLQVDFGMQRMDGGEVDEEDREFAHEVFREKIAGQMILSCDPYVDYEDNNTLSMRKSEKEKSATIQMQSSVKLVHNNTIVKSRYGKRYISRYLESGKLIRQERNVLMYDCTGPKVGQEHTLSTMKESFEVSPTGRLLWLQQFEDAGMLLTFKNRGKRARTWGDYRVFDGDDEGRKLVKEAQEMSCQVPDTGSSHLGIH